MALPFFAANTRPLGSLPLSVSVMVGGMPAAALMVKVDATPTVNAACAAAVIVGGAMTVSVNDCAALPSVLPAFRVNT